MRCLLLVDLQNDFMPYGALPVAEGSSVVPLANFLAPLFPLVVAPPDWHPATHKSFATLHPGKRPGDVIQLHGQPQVLWPDHCVQDTPGADFHPKIDQTNIHRVFRKGQNPEIDSYSGFFDNDHTSATGLHDFLQSKEITDLYLMGLATDYCVKYTALDAAKLGYHTFLVEDACRGVDLKPGDVATAIADMKAPGLRPLSSREIHVSLAQARSMA